MSNRNALYDKYRPRRLADVVGQRVAVRQIQGALRRGEIPHFILLEGIAGSGKTTIARIVARAILCPNSREHGDACGECETCRAETDDLLEIREIDAATNRSVDDVRERNAQLQYVSNRPRIEIANEVHMYTPEAFNSMLKLLEEPPANTYFIWTTTAGERVPAPIRTRITLPLTLRPVSVGDLTQHLLAVAQREGVELAPEAASFLASQSGGSVRQALAHLQGAILYAGDEPITLEAVQTMLGVAPQEQLGAVISALLAGNPGEALLALRTLQQDGTALPQIADGLASLSGSLAAFLLAPASLDLTEAQRTQLESLASGASLARVQVLGFQMLELSQRVHALPTGLHLEAFRLAFARMAEQAQGGARKPASPAVSPAPKARPAEAGPQKSGSAPVPQPTPAPESGEAPLAERILNTLRRINRVAASFMEGARMEVNGDTLRIELPASSGNAIAYLRRDDILPKIQSVAEAVLGRSVTLVIEKA